MTHMPPGRIPAFTLGERIRKAREDMGLSQQDFADRLGVHRKSVTNWESNRHTPRWRDLMLVALVTGIDLEWLAGDVYREEAAPSITARRTASNHGYTASRRRLSPRGAVVCPAAAAA